MNKIDYALAPSGSTHEYHGFWRKYEDGKWFFIDSGEWVPIKAQCSDDYTPIPEREIALNRLADTLAEWPYDKMYCMTINENNEQIQVTWIEWQDRRAERIKAGLIEVDNPITSSVTNSQAKEMELDMLKENNGLADVNDTDVVETIALGSKPETGRHYELKPHWHKVLIVAVYEHDENIRVVYWDYHNGKYGFTNFYDYLRPIKTAEQVAAERKKNWKHKLMDKLAFHISPDSTAENHIDLAASIVYEALLSGELEAPKGGDV